MEYTDNTLTNHCYLNQYVFACSWRYVEYIKRFVKFRFMFLNLFMFSQS